MNFTFGLNIENKYADGLFIYNCHRLVIAYKRPNVQEKDKDLQGIVGIVDIPYSILQPQQNKAAFQATNEINYLISKLGEHMECYSNYLNLDQGEFWKQYGYQTNFIGPPSSDDHYRKKRMTEVKLTVQCTNCLKWRTLSLQPRYLSGAFPPEVWTCRDNPDTSKNSCSIPELLEPIPVEQFKKKISTYNDYDRSYRENKEREMEQERREREKKLAQPKYTNSSMLQREVLSASNVTLTTKIQMTSKKRKVNDDDDDSSDKTFNTRSSSNRSKTAKRVRFDKNAESTVRASTSASIVAEESQTPHAVSSLRMEKDTQKFFTIECADSDSSESQLPARTSVNKYVDKYKTSLK